MTNFVYHNANGVRRTLITDTSTPEIVRVNTEVVMDEILDGIKRDRELQPARSINKLLARVPLTIYEQSVLEGWDDKKWADWLNDPDNAAFRVHPGRV